jgi:uncharacterized protein with HEPN domain
MEDERLYQDYLQDMLEAMTKAREFLGEMSLQEFKHDERTAFAVIRALEMLGEAARHIPDEIRLNNPDVPWGDMTGMRNVLIHDYLEVDLETVWLTVRNDLPDAEKEIRHMIEEEANG